MFSLLWSFSNRFLNASISTFCSSQQLPQEPTSSVSFLLSSVSDPSECSSSLLKSSGLMKCIPLLKSEAHLDVTLVLGVVACLLAQSFSIFYAISQTHKCHSFIVFLPFKFLNIFFPSKFSVFLTSMILSIKVYFFPFT